MNIGISTRAAQKEVGMSSAELARLMKTSPQNVTHIRETRNPTIQRVLDLAAIFNMSVDDFIKKGIV
jgi:transcriptional regulator with XRE-family HTH domain